jgi:hypothetical protein
MAFALGSNRPCVGADRPRRKLVGLRIGPANP